MDSIPFSTDLGGEEGRGRYNDGSGGFGGEKGFLNGSHTNLGSSSQLGGGRGAAGEGGRGGLGGRDSSSSSKVSLLLLQVQIL